MDIYNIAFQLLTVAVYLDCVVLVLLFLFKTRLMLFSFSEITANILLSFHPYSVDHYDIYVPNNPLLTSPEFANSDPIDLVPTYRVTYQWHILIDTEDSKKYIGLVCEVMDSNYVVVYCVDVIMNARSFFRFPIQLVKTYLLDMVYDAESDADLPLMVASDLCLLVGDYGLMNIPSSTVVFKTLWISVIQRVWRRIYAERMRRLILRGSPAAQRRFELCGNYGIRWGGILLESQQI